MSTKLSAAATDTMLASGWHPDRHEQALATELVAQVHQAQRKRREGAVQPFPYLIDTLARYGGLDVFNHGPGVTAHRESFLLVPLKGLVSEAALSELQELTANQESFFPLGAVPEIRGRLLLGASGRVVLSGPNGYFLMGADVNDALNNLISGTEPEYFSE